MSNEKTTLEAMLAQYDTVATSTSTSNTFDKTNYFSTYLEEGVNSKNMEVRILPTNGTPFQEIYVHEAKVDGKKRKFTCLQHMKNEACPFCEARELLLSSGDEAEKELAKNYRARKMIIVKVIDRANEEHGIKFWRFPVNFKQDGIHDKIIANIRMLGENITDAENGRDLRLNVIRVKNPRGGSYPTVNAILTRDKSPLSTDTEKAEKWLASTIKWEDVYSIKPYEYLELVVNGYSPMWDKKLNKFVSKESIDAAKVSEDVSEDLDDAITIDGANPIDDELTTNVEENSYTVDDNDDDEDDDLPF